MGKAALVARKIEVMYAFGRSRYVEGVSLTCRIANRGPFKGFKIRKRVLEFESVWLHVSAFICRSQTDTRTNTHTRYIRGEVDRTV